MGFLAEQIRARLRETRDQAHAANAPMVRGDELSPASLDTQPVDGGQGESPGMSGSSELTRSVFSPVLARVEDTSISEGAEPQTHSSPETVEILYQRIWFDYALRDGTYTPEELRQARKVVKPWGPVRTYRLVAVKQYCEVLGRWLLVITKAEGEVPPDARFLTPVAGGKARAWLTAAQLPQAAMSGHSGKGTAREHASKGLHEEIWG